MSTATAVIGPGSRDSQGSTLVRSLQEFLNLSGFAVAIDGDFGPATTKALLQFRQKNNVPGGPAVSGADLHEMELGLGLVVAEGPSMQEMWYHGYGLTQEAFIATQPRGFGHIAKGVAALHAHFGPREVGGDNRGPWVRLYMGGREGLPWCAGFVSTIWKQAAQLLNVKTPIPGGWSCTDIANQARGAGIFWRGEDIAKKGLKIPEGSLFVRRKKNADGSPAMDAWEHTGVVVEDCPAENVVHTIEGNTNDGGSREGYKVCEHTLRRDNRDYIFAEKA